MPRYIYAQEKFGYVDLSRVFYSYKKTEDYDAKLNKSREAKKKDRNKYIKEIMDLQNKLYLLNDKEKKNTLDALDKKRESLEKFDRQASTDLRKEEAELMKDILQEIEKEVREYAKKENYTLIFNDRLLLYGADALDLTDVILEALNNKYSKTKK
jgi:Skp family chaperone for outer membrane proteins